MTIIEPKLKRAVGDKQVAAVSRARRHTLRDATHDPRAFHDVDVPVAGEPDVSVIPLGGMPCGGVPKRLTGFGVKYQISVPLPDQPSVGA